MVLMETQEVWKRVTMFKRKMVNWLLKLYDNGAYGGKRSVKKGYYVQEEGGKLIVNTVYKKVINM